MQYTILLPVRTSVSIVDAVPLGADAACVCASRDTGADIRLGNKAVGDNRRGDVGLVNCDRGFED